MDFPEVVFKTFSWNNRRTASRHKRDDGRPPVGLAPVELERATPTSVALVVDVG
jgi:hypothetical protein